MMRRDFKYREMLKKELSVKDLTDMAYSKEKAYYLCLIIL